MRSSATAMFFVLLAIALFVVAVLYATGNLNFLATPARHHYKHALVAGVLGILSLVAASFSRRQTTARY